MCASHCLLDGIFSVVVVRVRITFLLRRLSALYAVHFAYVDLADDIYCCSLLLGALFHVCALHNFLLTDSPHI